MAAGAELSVLLAALIRLAIAYEPVNVRQEATRFSFDPPRGGGACLIARLLGHKRLVLWNSSAPWSQNRTSTRVSNYTMQNLTHSDSGRYQQQCWSEGGARSERNLSLLVCSRLTARLDRVEPGQTDVVLCDGWVAGLEVLWFQRDIRSREEVWGPVTEDGVEVLTGLRALRVSAYSGRFLLFRCAVLAGRRCLSSQALSLHPPTRVVYGSEGGTAALPCVLPGDDGRPDTQPPVWLKREEFSEVVLEAGPNRSLVLGPLTQNHSGIYACRNSHSFLQTFLAVCPERRTPPRRLFFSEGDDVALGCDGWDGVKTVLWFGRLNQSEVRFLDAEVNASLLLANATLQDAGEFWCAVTSHFQCLSTTTTLLLPRETARYDVTAYAARCAVLGALLLGLCAAVAAANRRGRG